MVKLNKTDHKDHDFHVLVSHLDAYLAKVDGEEHDFYNQFNGIQNLNHCIVAYLNGEPVACGAIKRFDENSMEVKRMFTLPAKRGQGLASKVLTALEEWAKALGYGSCILETGKRQHDAVAFYKKIGYEIVPNYGQYVGKANSLCFQKKF